MSKLYLGISDGVPDLPNLEKLSEGLRVERLKQSFKPCEPDGRLAAYFLDHEFLRRYGHLLTRENVLPGSILLWNPEGRFEDFDVAEELIYQELYGVGQPEFVLRALRNLYRNLYLIRELRIKEEQLHQSEKLNHELLSIGIALSAERDNEKLLDLIVYKTREITRSDAGSLYLLEENEETGERTLLFKISQNDSNPTDFTEFRMPVTTKSIAGYVATTGEVLNIEDAYTIPKNKPYGFNKNYDLTTGYRTKSLLTVPMRDHKERILGVIQLLNRKEDFKIKLADPQAAEEYVEPFDTADESVVLSLASQAAVSLDNNRLYQEIETLFEGFVRASVKAIEARDPTTSGHSNRVAIYTVGLAKAVDRLQIGRFGPTSFTPEQIKEIRYASLLHDFGKVGVREHVLVKAKKLYPHQTDLIELRFGYIKQQIEAEMMRRRFEFLKERGEAAFKREAARFDQEEREQIERLNDFTKEILEANEPKLLAEEPARAVNTIAGYSYVDFRGREQPYISQEERILLSIPRGSLNETERKEIESHVIHTFEFLQKIPWTGTMKNIPTIARWHHEKLNGDGYPDGKRSEDLPLQTKMMTVSDIFDALTAQDRPYKRAVPRERAIDILLDEAKDNHIDKDLVEVFIDAKIFTYKETETTSE